MHTPKLWKRGSSGNWYVQVGRQQVNLGRNRGTANEKYRAIVARLESFTTIPVVELLDEFLEWCEKNRADSTYRWYRDNLESFAKTIPALRVAELRPHHVTRWATVLGGGDNYQHNLIRAIQRVLNWAVRQGYLDRSPLAGMEKPTPTASDTFITPEQFMALIARVTDQEFRDLLIVLWETGCRPQEARQVRAEHFDATGGRWVFGVQERGKLKGRIVYLTDTAVEITTRLAALNPTGPIFRNRKGNPWRKDAIVNRFQRLKMPFPVTAYAIRHGWATEALKRGVDPVTVSKCLGHSDGRMLQTVYAHVDADGDHMRAAVRKARGVAVVSYPLSPAGTDPVPLA